MSCIFICQQHSDSGEYFASEEVALTWIRQNTGEFDYETKFCIVDFVEFTCNWYQINLVVSVDKFTP